MKYFDIIIAKDINNGIGIRDEETNEYKMGWKINNDMKHFKNITTHTDDPLKKNAIIMGRITWDTIPNENKPLIDRINIILTKDTTKISTDNILFFNDFELAYTYLTNCNDIESIFVIGGGKLIESCINDNRLRYIYITTIEMNYKCNIKIDIDKYLNNVIWESNINTIDILSNLNVNIRYAKYNSIQYMNIHPEYQYLNLLQKIIKEGKYKKTRNANTWSLFGDVITYNIYKDGFPIITTKRIPLRLVFEELKFFLLGETDATKLMDKNVHIWDANTSQSFLDKNGLNNYEIGTMGPMYGFNWRYYGAEYKDGKTDYTNKGIDQFKYIIDIIKNDYTSRRIIMTTLDRNTVEKSVLWPCHGIVIQFACEDIDNIRLLHCNMYQRSCDIICGIPFNLSSYSLLIYIICEIINNDETYIGLKLFPGTLKMYLGDIHLYDELTHMNAVNEHNKRIPLKLPNLYFKKKITNIIDLDWNDIVLNNYDSYPSIKVNMIA